MGELEEKAKETERILKEWISKQGHDRCWWHPALLDRLGKLYGLDMSQATNLVSLETFQRGCRLYQAIEYGYKIPEDCRDIVL